MSFLHGIPKAVKKFYYPAYTHVSQENQRPPKPFMQKGGGRDLSLFLLTFRSAASMGPGWSGSSGFSSSPRQTHGEGKPCSSITSPAGPLTISQSVSLLPSPGWSACLPLPQCSVESDSGGGQQQLLPSVPMWLKLQVPFLQYLPHAAEMLLAW